MPRIEAERLLIRPAEEADVEALAALLVEPEVAHWWRGYDADKVRAELADSHVVVVDGVVIGLLMLNEETDPDYPSVSFDIALATAHQGRGYATEALRAAIRYYAARGHHRFAIDPAVDNERAVRAYEAVGFKPVGVMRAYERLADGTYRDGLLMDMLADELRERAREG
jgi:aminoglycoside 6'-N-acetyltransferase